MSAEPVHIISLGAGVQSSVMAMMAACGEIGPMPACAIFADTQAEPKAVYEWLGWLSRQLPFPILQVSRGNLAENALRVMTSKGGNKYTNSNIPVFLKAPDGHVGIQSRQCTGDYKIVPVQRKTRELIGRKRSAKAIMWIGISTDEAHRMKPSRKAWIENRFPLIDEGISRKDCLQWMKDRGFPEPPRSSCSFCPYHGNDEWLRIKNDEAAWSEAVQFDKDYRKSLSKVPQIKGTPFLHRSCVPLDEVDFRSSDEKTGQVSLFGNECEGMCGL